MHLRQNMSLYTIPLGKFADPDSQYSIDQIKNFQIPKDSKYFHSTSLEACRNMLSREEKEYYELWASHIDFSNDQKEYSNGLSLIIDQLCKRENKWIPYKFVEGFIKSFDEDNFCVNGLARDIFILCFSMNSNSLTQWKYYGKNCGVAIEYNLTNCKYSGFLANDARANIVNNAGPYKVIYDDKEKIRIINAILETAKTTYKTSKDEGRDRTIETNLEKLYAICPLFKHKDFFEEKECRLIFRPLYHEEANNYSDLFNYRFIGEKLLPYLKIRIHPYNDNFTPPIISSITIGPGTNQSLVCKSIKHMITRNNPDINLNNINVSSTPFRG